MDYEAFLSVVEESPDVEQPGMGRDEAQGATWAVLETLAERINPRIIDHLMSRLPLELHAPLQRGQAHHDGRPRDLPLEKFLDEVSEREGVDRDRATVHTEAVFEALREAVGDNLFGDLYQL